MSKRQNSGSDLPAEACSSRNNAHVIDRRTDRKNWTCACGVVVADNEHWRGQPYQFVNTDAELDEYVKQQGQ